MMSSASGAWARFALTDRSACVALNSGVCDDDAAALLINPLTAVALMALVRESGARVRRGQTLAWIYAPEILRAEEELLVAHRWAGAPSEELQRCR